MKKGTLRPKDLADAEALRQRFEGREEPWGVTRYRTFREAEDALWRRPGDPVSLRIASSLFALVRWLRVIPPPRGVQRYRTLDEAQRARSAWEELKPPKPRS